MGGGTGWRTAELERLGAFPTPHSETSDQQVMDWELPLSSPGNDVDDDGYEWASLSSEE